MSLAVRVSRAEGARRWREHDAERMADFERRRNKEQARVKGLPVLRQLDNGREVEWRERRYHAPPTPYEVALDVLDAQQRFDALVQAGKRHLEAPDTIPPPDVQEWRAVFRETVRLFKCVYKPPGWRRLVWFLTPSPLRNAPPSEVGRALGFFSALRTQDAIDQLLTEAAHLQTGTSPGASTATSKPIQPSANGAGSSGGRSGRSPGKRSSWGSR